MCSPWVAHGPPMGTLLPMVDPWVPHIAFGRPMRTFQPEPVYYQTMDTFGTGIIAAVTLTLILTLTPSPHDTC